MSSEPHYSYSRSYRTCPEGSTKRGGKNAIADCRTKLRYLLSLVNELMDFRKLDKNKVVLDKRSTHFIHFLSEILIPFQVFAKERQIEISTYLRLDNPFLVVDPDTCARS